MAADRGIQLRRRPHGVRIETKPQYTSLIGRLLPERKAEAHHLAGARNPGHRRAQAARFDRRYRRHPRHRKRRHHPDPAQPQADRALGAARPRREKDLADHAAVPGNLWLGVAR